MAIITILFYLFAFIPFGLECDSLKNPSKTVAINAALKSKKLEDQTKDEKAHGYIYLMYALWAFIGLFTSQWAFFGSILILSLFPKKSVLGVGIDAIVSIFLILALVVNRFHFHIQL